MIDRSDSRSRPAAPPRETWSDVKLLPQKRLPVAKSRLALGNEARVALTLAFLADAVEAAVQAALVDDVVVVTDDVRAGQLARAAGVRWWREHSRPGLNPVLRHALIRSAIDRPSSPVAVLLPDVPALRAEHLDIVLQEAMQVSGPAIVTDAAGTGTTLLAGPNAAALSPRFAAVRRGLARPPGTGRQAPSSSAPLSIRCAATSTQSMISRPCGRWDSGVTPKRRCGTTSR